MLDLLARSYTVQGRVTTRLIDKTQIENSGTGLSNHVTCRPSKMPRYLRVLREFHRGHVSNRYCCGNSNRRCRRVSIAPLSHEDDEYIGQISLDLERSRTNMSIATRSGVPGRDFVGGIFRLPPQSCDARDIREQARFFFSFSIFRCIDCVISHVKLIR